MFKWWDYTQFPKLYVLTLDSLSFLFAFTINDKKMKMFHIHFLLFIVKQRGKRKLRLSRVET